VSRGDERPGVAGVVAGEAGVVAQRVARAGALEQDENPAVPVRLGKVERGLPAAVLRVQVGAALHQGFHKVEVAVLCRNVQ